MTYVFLGFTFLLADLFPIGTYLMMFVPGIHMMPHGMATLLTVLIKYLPAALITAWFFRSEKFRERVPAPIPGGKLLMVGVVMTLLTIAAAMFASTVEGGGGAYLVGSIAVFIILPARILMLFGIVKFLLGMPAVATAEKRIG
ncbi:hypothetical protein [Undibacterium sp. Ji49W]|uniref:hypothetical protein n=1 Tax=Undibacterium sp. Ji49W TaxID=3413040 RepID=UPI003BF38490